MKALLEYLERCSYTLTIYDYAGTDEQRQDLSSWLSGYGVQVRTATSDLSVVDNVAVLHRAGEVIDACAAETLLERTGFEDALGETDVPRPEILSSLSTAVSVKPALTVQEMVRVSRNFERRALREGAGTLHAGFQYLSQIAGSQRTMEMYTALANEGVDVRVYGYPNTALEDVPFTVVADSDRELERHWFLLYDGNGTPTRKATLVSEERPVDGEDTIPTAAEMDTEMPAGTYDSFVTTDPGTVDELFELAHEEHGTLLADGG